MKIVVAGSRNYRDYYEAKKYIDSCVNEIGRDNTFVFISGGCKGADELGERYAAENGFEIERYPAEWSKFGKSVGPVRNKAMAEAADFVICFWDGKSRGTKSMIELAEKEGKTVRIKIVSRTQ
ncbi:MAG: DUF2493 domain-containing protein [Clostridia bacterium]|nr:DUF2493 domain-containing protein [Clostridia bacterium]